MKTISPAQVRRFMARFPNLSELGLMNEMYAVCAIGADKLGCRPCDVREVARLPNGAITIQRIS